MSRRPKVLSVEESAELLAQAEAVLERWQGEAGKLMRSAEVLAAELAEAEARAADDVLDDEDDPEALARVAEALGRRRTEQGLAVQAAERAAERLCGVCREVLRARGAAVRTRAEELRKVAAARQARADQLLAELAEFEGVPFGPVARADSMGLVAAGFTPRTLTQRLHDRAKWLMDNASGHEQISQDGSDDQVAQWAARGMPPLDDAEVRVSAVEAAR